MEEEIIYKKISPIQKLPEQKDQELNSSFFTDKGKLYYWFYEKLWSCSEDKISEEYPNWWLEPQSEKSNGSNEEVYILLKEMGAACKLAYNAVDNNFMKASTSVKLYEALQKCETFIKKHQ